MKFAEQVASYHGKLRRRSRFFSSLMLVSGISLAAAAPFLSYEVSQIECAEKGSVAVTQDNSEELQTLKNELEGKDEAITQLEKKVDDQNSEIDKLASNPDCENLVQVIKDERDRLDGELTEVTTESLAKDEAIAELKREVEEKNEEITDLTSNPDCDNLVRVVEKDRDRLEEELTEVTTISVAKDKYIKELKGKLNECEEKLNQIGNSEPDCEKFSEEIIRLERIILTKDLTIAELKASLKEAGSCPALKLSGTFHHREVFIFSGINFRVDINQDDVGARYQFFRNNKNITTKLNNSTYTFNAGGAKYQFKLQGPKGNLLPYSLTSL